MSTSSAFQRNSFNELLYPLLNSENSTSKSNLTPNMANYTKPHSIHLSPESNNMLRHQQRPVSEILKPDNLISPETQALDKWFEDLQEYESSLESMASASLDPKYKEEVHHVDQWFRYLNEAERTSTIYTLLQHSTQVQIKFFITVLQQMSNKDPLVDLLSPAYPEKDMQSQLSNTMKTAELDATQKLLSVNNINARNNIDRHSFALGDTKEYDRFFSRSEYLTPPTSNTFRPGQNSRQRNVLAGRPKSVIEGDLTSLFPNEWSTNIPSLKHGSIGSNRPKSADISNWSFGLSSSSSKHLRENDTPDIDTELSLLANNWNIDNYRNASRIPPVLESDEPLSIPVNLTGPANIVLSSYDDSSRPSTIYSSENYNVQPSSPLPSQTLNPYRNSLHKQSNSFGQFLNPHDRTLDSENGYISDHSDASNRSNRSRGQRRSNNHHQNHHSSRGKDNKRSMEVVDMKLLEDVPAWLRSLRLHKYNPIFETTKWQEMVKYDDEMLLNKGVAALGARRKLLKVFDIVKAHCETNDIAY